MTALVFGPEALQVEQKKFEYEIPSIDGVVKKKSRTLKVIEQKGEIKEKGVFKIGHSVSESMTFMPSTYRRDGDETNSHYVDVAGLHDTGGDFIDFINVFVNKQLFKPAKSVRFLVPITYASQLESRGKVLKD